MRTLIKFVGAVMLLGMSSHPVSAGPWAGFPQDFIALMRSVATIGDEAAKDYVLGQLTKLHRDLYLIERDKQYLIQLMERPGLVDENVSEVLKDLKDTTEHARERLKGIGDRVARLSADASRLETHLNEALTSRKYWLSRINVNDPRDSNLDQLLAEGRTAIKAVHDSRIELERFLGAQ